MKAEGTLEVLLFRIWCVRCPSEGFGTFCFRRRDGCDLPY
jgi:hypothetical protein